MAVRNVLLARSVMPVMLAVFLLGCESEGAASRSGDSREVVTEPSQASEEGWTRIAESPLEARHGSVGVWTGNEMVVAGGTTAPPCPLGADCVELAGRERVDGAAFDPEAETWRPIADAPEAFAGAQAVWSGEEMLVVTATSTLAYDPVTDRWRALSPPPAPLFEPAPPVVTDAGVVFVSYDQGRGQDPTDWLLDPTSGRWSPLPRDPFGESYDRSLAWDGTRLWLLSMAVEEHFGAFDGSTSRLAVLEGGVDQGAWRIVDASTPEVFQGQVQWWPGARLVVPSGISAEGPVRTFDTGTEQWTEIRGGTTSGCRVPRIGPGPRWIADGPVLTALDGASAHPVPACPALPDPDVAVWAEDDLLMWGGPSPGFEGGSADGLIWRPPS